MNILIIGNVYYINCYKKYIGTVHKDIAQVYYLPTSFSEITLEHNEIRVDTKSQLLSIVSIIDQIYIMDDGKISQKLVELLYATVNKTSNISFVKMQGNKNNMPSIEVKKDDVIVLVLYEGEYSQHGLVELELYDVFAKNNIAINQLPSMECSTIINMIKADRHCAHISELGKNVTAALSIVSLDVNEVTESFVGASNIRPDYVIYCVENNCMDIENKINRLYYTYGINVDTIIYSNYISYNNEYGSMLFCSKKLPTQYNCKSISLNENCGNILFERIMYKLYYPKEISKV